MYRSSISCKYISANVPDVGEPIAIPLQYFKPEKGIAMGSPISGTLAEIYLQLIEERYIKHWIENQNIVYYKRYVDDIFIIFDTSGINEETIKDNMNSIDEHLEFNP